MTVMLTFVVKTCEGDYVNCLTMDVDLSEFDDYPDLFDFDIAEAYRNRVFSALGINNYICESCYDHAYNLQCDNFEGRP